MADNDVLIIVIGDTRHNRDDIQGIFTVGGVRVVCVGGHAAAFIARRLAAARAPRRKCKQMSEVFL